MSTSRNRVDQLVANNGNYSKTFTGAPTMDQIRALTRSPEGHPVYVLTCVDPRSVPEAFFGPELRSAVHRNAGGRATQDVVRSLNVLRALLGLNTVVVVHHTDCGMSHIGEDEIRKFAKSKNAEANVDSTDFGVWKEEDLEETVKEDVRKLREEKSLEGLEVYGFTLDTQTGAVKEVNI